MKTEMEMESRRRHRWAILLWSLSATGVVTGYLFGLPLFLLFLDTNTSWSLSGPVLDQGLDLLLFPLNALYERSGAYQDYIAWVERVVEP